MPRILPVNFRAWSNVLLNDGEQCGRCPIRHLLQKATSVLTHSSEHPALANSVAPVVLSLQVKYGISDLDKITKMQILISY